MNEDQIQNFTTPPTQNFCPLEALKVPKYVSPKGQERELFWNHMKNKESCIVIRIYTPIQDVTTTPPILFILGLGQFA